MAEQIPGTGVLKDVHKSFREGRDEILKGGDQTPGHDLTGKPPLRPRALEEDIRGNLQENDASRQETVPDIDLVRVDA